MSDSGGTTAGGTRPGAAASEALPRHCTPQAAGAAWADAEIERRLLTAGGHWALHGDAIERCFAFKNFHQTMAFVNALAWICHREDHHPELTLSYASCRVRFSTHSAGGVTVNDLICAAQVDALLADGC